ncbi:copper-transporting ATPase, partial [Edaphobacter sp. HDX4]
QIVVADGVNENDLLQMVASLERASEHPLAAAIVAGAEECGVALAEVKEFASVTGKGVTGVIDGRRVAVGTSALLREEGIDAGAM